MTVPKLSRIESDLTAVLYSFFKSLRGTGISSVEIHKRLADAVKSNGKAILSSSNTCFIQAPKDVNLNIDR